jgi:hypothetical protein
MRYFAREQGAASAETVRKWARELEQCAKREAE